MHNVYCSQEDISWYQWAVGCYNILTIWIYKTSIILALVQAV